jgi:hypothetical protein
MLAKAYTSLNLYQTSKNKIYANQLIIRVNLQQQPLVQAAI